MKKSVYFADFDNPPVRLKGWGMAKLPVFAALLLACSPLVTAANLNLDITQESGGVRYSYEGALEGLGLREEGYVDTGTTINLNNYPAFRYDVPAGLYQTQWSYPHTLDIVNASDVRIRIISDAATNRQIIYLGLNDSTFTQREWSKFYQGQSFTTLFDLVDIQGMESVWETTDNRFTLRVIPVADQEWDGANTTFDGEVSGGSGIWDATRTNWTYGVAQFNEAWRPTNGAIFSGTTGTVTIADGFIAESPSLSFQTDGYVLEADGTGALHLSGTGTVEVLPGLSATISAPITDGLLTKTGEGTLTLIGANTYLGDTFVSAGTLQIGDGGTTGSIVSDVVNNGFLIFNRSDDTSYGGDIIGTGGLGKLGAGRLELTGSNSGDLGTFIDAGTMAVTGTINHPDGSVVVANGSGSNGALEITGSGSVASGFGLIGFGEGSTGLATVTSGSWTNTMTLVIGGFGEGLLEIRDTGVVTSVGGILGSDADASGIVRVSGGSWINSDVLGIGESGTGLLEISGTGMISNTIGTLAFGATSTGTASITGGIWTNSVGLMIGDEGQGTVDLTGGVLNAPNVEIASRLGSTGTLNFGTGTTVGTLNANSIVGGNGTAIVNFNHTGTVIFTPDLEGSVQVNKLVSGTTILAGNNTYTGRTTIAGGTLASGNLVNSVVMVQGGGAFSPGGVGMVQNITVSGLSLDGGNLIFEIGTGGTDFISVADGRGALNAATQFLLANTGLSNGLYPLLDGLAPGWNLRLLSFSGIAPNEGSFLLSDDGTQLFFSAFDGGIITGAVSQNSAPVGTPTIADFLVQGLVTTGTPTVNNTINSLIFNPNSSLQVFNNLTVTSGNFNVPMGSATMTGGTVIVPGTFSKLGGGLLNVFSKVLVNGPTHVMAGSLLVNGTFTTGGGLTVFQNALLGGAGIINGNVFNNGIVSPGNSPGTLTINGNYTQSGSGTLLIEFGDLLRVSGQASLAGTLHYLGGGKMKYGQQVTFLQAGSIAGEFDQIQMPDSDRFRGRFLAEGGTGILLVAPTSYTLVAETTNQHNVAKALDSFIPARGDDREAVSTTLDYLSADQYPAAFDQIAPTFYESLIDISFEQINAQNQMLVQRLSSLRLGARGFQSIGIESPLMNDKDGKSALEAKDGKDILAPSADNRWGAFAIGNGIFAQASPVNQLSNYHFEGGGFSAGLDYRWSENFATGVYVGYQGAYAKYDDGSTASINGVNFGGFATYENGGFYADAILGGGYSGYDVRRSIQFSTVDRTARSNPGGGNLTTYLNTGYDWQAGGFTFGPILGGQYTYAGMGTFTESNADSLNLKVGQQNANSIRTTLGGHVAYTWKLTDKITIIPELRMFWQHEFLENPRNIGAALDSGSGPSFGYETSAPDRDAVFAGAGVSAQFGKDWSAFFFYNADFGRQDYFGNYVSAGLGVKF